MESGNGSGPSGQRLRASRFCYSNKFIQSSVVNEEVGGVVSMFEFGYL